MSNFDKQIYDSGLIAQGCWDELDNYTREAIEKFGELIVRECVGRSAELGQPEIGQGLMKHFGVEEPSIDRQLRNRSTYFGNDL